MDNKTCSIGGCDDPVRSRGMCSLHYTRWIKSGKRSAGPSGRLIQQAAGRVCATPSCGRPVRCSGLCSRCYSRAGRRSKCACGNDKTSTAAVCQRCYDASFEPPPVDKKCTKCGDIKLIADFGWRKDGRGRSKVRSSCRACDTAQSAAYRATLDPGRIRDRKRREAERLRSDPERRFWRSIRSSARRLGLDIDEVVDRIREFGNKCEACGVEFELGVGNRRVHLDHCHTTGKFRGLLCQSCNFLVGYSGDNPDLLEHLAAYLRLRSP